MDSERITPLVPVFEGNALTILWTRDLKRDLLPFIPERHQVAEELASLATMAERLHRLADDDNHKPESCYFIGGDAGPIKIGKSLDPQSRLKQIQMCSPIKLRILALAPGGGARERAYHCQFGEHWSHGEWYDRHPDLMAEIDKVNADLIAAIQHDDPDLAKEISEITFPLSPAKGPDDE